jgi:radical SAM superfamily enzyme YgiQ (UPF0313 family)
MKGKTMNILLVYPRYPDTFWSFRHALKFISTPASFPPLGLLTVAAMLPKEWEKRLIDMDVRSLKDEAIRWADYVFISAMAVQKKSAQEVIDRCKKLGTKTVVGGPLFTADPAAFDGVDHLVLNEAEVTFPRFLADLHKGTAQHIVLNGRVPRTKSKEQVLAELTSLYDHGWRHSVFFVDDNFIGNRNKLKAEILPAVIEWMKERKYPFSFVTETSINLADDKELMQLMVQAGFDMVFVGIETPHEESLAECSKLQNKNRDLVASVQTIQQNGMQVMGGFIVGFDQDPPSIFERQISFIQKSGIVTAMVGLLNAPRGTRLYKRLHKENRLLHDITGDNTDCSINFVPKMGQDALFDGYRKIMKTIYSPRHYYKRIRTFFREYRPLHRRNAYFSFSHLNAFLKTFWLLGIQGKERFQYWRLIASTLLKRPRSISLAVTLAIYGFHFRRVFKELVRAPRGRGIA